MYQLRFRKGKISLSLQSPFNLSPLFQCPIWTCFPLNGSQFLDFKIDKKQRLSINHRWEPPDRQNFLQKFELEIVTWDKVRDPR
jgi:hypothetical protein